MKIAVISDPHLGYKQYGLSAREDDFIKAFNKTIDKIITHEPDMLICCGDIFEVASPASRFIKVFQDALRKLKKANIEMVSIIGNHEKLNRHTHIPTQYLFDIDYDLTILDEHNDYNIIKGDTIICGIPYHTLNKRDQIVDIMNDLSEKSKSYENRILILHQGIDKYMFHGADLELEDIPKNFDLYLVGHLHNRIVDVYGEGVLIYPGSTEIHSTAESTDYYKNGKGYTIIDTDTWDYDFYDINLERDFLIERLSYENIEEDIEKLSKTIKEGSILKLTVFGENIDREFLYYLMDTYINHKVLKCLLSIENDDSQLNDENVNNKELSIESLISSYFDDDIKNDFSLRLFNKMSSSNKDNREDGILLADDFFKNSF